VPKKQTDDILAKRGVWERSTFPELAQINKALAERYGVPPAEELEREPEAEMTGYSDLANWRTEASKQRAEAHFWRLIAYNLARDAGIPAFQSRHAPKFKDSLPAWIAANGSLYEAPADFTAFDGARFVLAIRELEQGKGLAEKAPSREWIFGWLLNKRARDPSPERAQGRLDLIPLRFRSNKSVESLNVAYYTIHKDVRAFPERYLPTDDPRRKPEYWPGWPGWDGSDPTVTSARKT
jgi:hypothetical protein